jgi:uncharacterized membrane-anchored protein YhcB (DUF1043 family)
MKKIWNGTDRRLGRKKPNLWLGAKLFYTWIIQTLALIIALAICLSLVRDLGGWFTSRELKMLMAGAVIGFSVASYRLLKRKESWNRRGAEMEAEIQDLRDELEREQNPPEPRLRKSA